MREIQTRNDLITLTDTAEEGEVEYAVTCHGVSKKSGRSITPKGLAWHTHNAIDNCPGRYIGSIFKTGRTTHTIEDQCRPAVLNVTRDEKTLVDEQGVWVGENP